MSQIEWIYTISWIAFSVVVLAYALCRQPEPAALGGPASESGRLRQGTGTPKGGNRCRRGLVLTTLSTSRITACTRARCTT
jgi:hypothetical protein